MTAYYDAIPEGADKDSHRGCHLCGRRVSYLEQERL